MFDDMRLDSEIATAVKKEWDDHGVPLLLSQLGLNSLTPEAKQFVSDNRVSLKRYIRGSLSDRLRLIPMKREGGGIAPTEETVDISDQELEERFAKYLALKASGIQRVEFSDEIWHAFADPMDEGTRRIVSFSERVLSVQTVSQDAQVPEGTYAIEKHDTAIAATLEATPDFGAVRDAIWAWCDHYGIDRARVEAQTPRRSPKPRPVKPSSMQIPEQIKVIGFIEVLQALPRDQLARLTIPGDVLLSILELVNQR